MGKPVLPIKMEHQNSEITNRISEDTKLPATQINRQVTPVLIANPTPEIKLVTGVKSTSGNATIMTTNSSKKTYLIGYVFDIIKDATCNVATGDMSIFCKPKGLAEQDFLKISVITTTAQDKSISHTFQKPILLEKNSVIAFNNDTYAAGVCVRTASIYYYEVDEL